ncbi:MAG: murein biosynthesis integral membrane protein MurJ [Rhodospirillaceae bacterium]|nr:murein biosynthesis integral membrane protein MurJ [Rhodospirillaceae bacterium]
MALLRSSLIVGSNTLLSRIFGYVRDILIARALGTTGVVEAFVVAFRFPNLFRRLVAEGAFTSAFVPIFAKKLAKEGKGPALRFAENTLAWLLLILALFTVAAEIFMPAIIGVVAPGFRDQPALFDAAVLLTRLTLPYLIAMTIVALMSGVLNTFDKFAMAAAAPTLLNVIMILGLVFATPWFKSAGHMLAWAVAIAGIAQYLWLGYACWKAGLQLRLPIPHYTAATRRLLKLMVPGIVGGGMTQINLLVGTIIASFIAGAVSILYFADRVYQFPLGMIGIAIGTALLPELSRKIHNDPAAANALQNRAVELSMLLTLPAATALVAVAEPVVLVMFQYGRFTAADAHATALALMAFSVGLPAYVLIRVFAPGFYAREDTRSPVIYAVISMATNIVLSVALVWPPFGLPSLGALGIAVATAIAAWINAGLLAVMLARRGHWRIDAKLKSRLPRLLLAALLMAAALVPLALALDPWLHGAVYARVAAMIALVAAGMAVYGALCLGLKAADLGELKQMLRRRRGRKAGNASPPPPSVE